MIISVCTLHMISVPYTRTDAYDDYLDSVSSCQSIATTGLLIYTLPMASSLLAFHADSCQEEKSRVWIEITTR